MDFRELKEISDVLDKVRDAFVKDASLDLTRREVKVLGEVIVSLEGAVTELLERKKKEAK